LWDFDNQEKNQKEREDALTILRPFFPTLQLNRIECFDASHHWGNYLYVGMAVLIKGLIDKSQYRLFAIKTATNNDPQALKEALERRLKHLSDWGKPDLIILDGGLPQIQIVGPLLKKSHLAYIGLAKPEERLHIPEKNVTLKATGGLLTLTTRLRDEAHRFTINQSRKAFLNRR
jgi:excinuclease ABC subunit C